MANQLRVLTAGGMASFRQYLDEARQHTSLSPPFGLLASEESSTPLGNVEVEQRAFTDRFAFGSYLAEILGGLDRRSLSRNHGLWTWLALYYFDQLCPKRPDGTRRLLSPEAYLLPERYDFRGYYRHLVRTPWLAVSDHGERARVLLIPTGRDPDSPLARRGEIIEQLASRQAVLGNPRIIEAVYRLYFDDKGGHPHRGTGGSKGGSPRRLALILQQLDLTFDLVACDAAKLIGLLPKEFDRWRPV